VASAVLTREIGIDIRVKPMKRINRPRSLSQVSTVRKVDHLPNTQVVQHWFRLFCGLSVCVAKSQIVEDVR
jgi:hypothetical protein